MEELENVQDLVDGNLEVRENFISEEEESLLLKEVEPYLKRQKYQYDHWDDVSVLCSFLFSKLFSTPPPPPPRPNSKIRKLRRFFRIGVKKRIMTVG